MSRIPPAVIVAVEDRAGWACEGCGRSVLHPVFHHRRAYQMGGRQADDPLQNIPANILRLHDACHTYAHAHSTWAETRGLIVRQGTDPRDVPVIVGPIPPRRC